MTNDGVASSVLQYISTHPCGEDRIKNQKRLLTDIVLEQARYCNNNDQTTGLSSGSKALFN